MCKSTEDYSYNKVLAMRKKLDDAVSILLLSNTDEQIDDAESVAKVQITIMASLLREHLRNKKEE